MYNINKENASECGRKGGVKSGETRRRKREMKDIINSLLNMPLKSGKISDVDEIKNFAALKGKNLTVAEAISIRQMQKALSGDLNAAIFIRDTSGQKPKENMTLETIPVPVFKGEEKLED